MTKGETIAYAINKECCKFSLADWCAGWGFTIDEFRSFLECGKIGFNAEDSKN